MYEQALSGVFCEDDTFRRLQRLGRAFDWAATEVA
jgi:hypothetical protein